MSKSYHVTRNELLKLPGEELVQQAKEEYSQFNQYLEKKYVKKSTTRLRKYEREHKKVFGESQNPKRNND